MSTEDKTLQLLDQVEDKLKNFEKSGEAEKKARETSEAELRAELEAQRKQLQELAEVAKNIKAQPKGKREIYRALAEGVIRAQSGQTDNKGGYLVEDEISRELRSVQEEHGTVARIWGNRIVPMASDKLLLPVMAYGETEDNQTEMQELDESEEIVADTAKLSQVSLTTQKVGTLIYIPNELLDDSQIDVLGQWLVPQIGMQSAKKLDQFVLTAATHGMLNNTNIQTLTMGSGDGAFTDIDYDYLFDMEDSVAGGALGQAVYVAHRSIHTLIRKLKDDNGQYLNPNVAGGGYATINGYDAYKSEVMPARTASAVSTGFVLFGDLPSAMVVGRRKEQDIQTDQSLRFNFDQTALRFLERYARGTNADIGRAAVKLRTNAST